MSNIFEGLKRGNQKIASLALSPLGESTGAPEEAFAAPPDVPVVPIPQPDGTPPVPKTASSISDWQVRRLPLSIPASMPLLPFDQGASHAAEQYRILRTKIIQHPSRPRVIVVSSAMPGDGKSVTAINLAGVLALKSDASVLLLDADLRHSSACASLGLPTQPGLHQVLEGRASLEEAVIALEDLPHMYVLGAGEGQRNPTELLDSANWSALCSRLRCLFKYIVIDSPPIGALADYDLIQSVSDGVILVARPDHTNRKLCFKALQAIPLEKLLGVLLNCVPDWYPGRSSSNYSYRYYGDLREGSTPTARR
jgi:capsular exopolysaccharide synthesis family protein